MTEEMQKFREQTQEEDRQRVIQAMEEMAKKQAEESDVVHEGPVVLGYLIKPDEEITPLREIQDEESRVTIEGYVFDVEIKEFRSGRTLLTLK